MSGSSSREDLGDAPLVAGIEEGEEAGDGDRLALALGFQLPRQRPHALLVQRP